MNAYVLIIALVMPASDGGVTVNWVPFATKEACEAAAKVWDTRAVMSHGSGRGVTKATCHATR